MFWLNGQQSMVLLSRSCCNNRRGVLGSGSSCAPSYTMLMIITIFPPKKKKSKAALWDGCQPLYTLWTKFSRCWSLGPGSVNFGACSGNSFDLSLTANFDANVASGCLRRNDISMDRARNKINSTSESVTHVSFFLRWLQLLAQYVNKTIWSGL